MLLHNIDIGRTKKTEVQSTVLRIGGHPVFDVRGLSDFVDGLRRFQKLTLSNHVDVPALLVQLSLRQFVDFVRRKHVVRGRGRSIRWLEATPQHGVELIQGHRS